MDRFAWGITGATVLFLGLVSIPYINEFSGRAREMRLEGVRPYAAGELGVSCPKWRTVCTVSRKDGSYLNLRCNDFTPGCTVEGATEINVKERR